MATEDAARFCALGGKSGQQADSQTEPHLLLKAPGMWSTFSIAHSLHCPPRGEALSQDTSNRDRILEL